MSATHRAWQRRLLAITLTAIALGAAACGSDEEPSAQITMQDLQFSPREATLRVGERVTWQNNESTPHNVIANTGATFRSELIQRDGTFAFTPARPGVIRYFCSLHRGMTATLRVTPK